MSFECIASFKSFGAKAFSASLCWSVGSFFAPVTINVISEGCLVSVNNTWDHASNDHQSFEDTIHWIGWTNNNKFIYGPVEMFLDETIDNISNASTYLWDNNLPF